MFSAGMGPVYLRLMFTGLLFTLAISAGSLTIGAILGFILGTGRTSSILWLRAVITLYVEAIRSVPLLIFLFLVFYGLPVVTGLVIAPLTAAIVTQGIYVSAYMTEIVRTGIQAVPNGQWQASRALGLGYWRTMRWIVMPQALRIMVPPAAGLFIANIKDSSLASIIGVNELTQTALTIRQQTLSNWDVFALLAIGYLLINSVVSVLSPRVEHRLRRSERFRVMVAQEEAQVQDEVIPRDILRKA
jgi:His/Glu/Gln/Arg/opine family amino acid ABC transporter permease subunit